MVNKIPVVGVVYNPIMDEMFHAIKKKGSFKNETQLKVNETTGMLNNSIRKRNSELNDNILICLYSIDFCKNQLHSFTELDRALILSEFGSSREEKLIKSVTDNLLNVVLSPAR